MDAGSDAATVEEQDVTINGSATRDPDNDPLTYQWSLESAPNGSGVKVDATTATFAFRPDVPGDYQLRLTANDGFSNASDTVRVSADRLFHVSGNSSFKIDGASPAGSDRLDLKLKTSPRFTGGAVAFTATSNMPWLSVPATGTFAGADRETTLAVSLNLAEVKQLQNGEYVARITITPNGGWTGESPDVKLDFALPRVRNVLPYLAYVNEPSRVTLYGEKLQKADGKSLFIGGVEALNLDATSETRATIDLPPLPAGTYTVRIAHALDVAPEMARVVVRALPVYRDVDNVGIEGPIQSLAYDAERDAIYYVMISAEGLYFTQSLRKDGTGGWSSGPAPPISAPTLHPRALALSPDGTEIYVSSLGCVLHRVNADTLAVIESVQKPCDPNAYFGEIAPLADGRVLLVEEGAGQDAVFTFPGFAPTDVLPVRRPDASVVLNAQRDRLLYVHPTGVGQPILDVYDIEDVRSRSVTLSEPALGRVTMNGDGSRTLNSINLYDREFRLLGKLVADVPWGHPGTALNFSGTRAVALDEQTKALYVHDVSGPGPTFPQVGAPIPVALTDEASHNARLLVPPSGGAVFAIALVDSMAGRGSFSFYVRTSPAITR